MTHTFDSGGFFTFWVALAHGVAPIPYLFSLSFQTKNCCLKFLRQTMNSSNCLNHCQLGSLYSDEGLVEAATSYFCRNFEAVSQSQHFLENATVEDLAYFLENETITVKDESIILKTIISWTDFDLENRANNFENLLPFVQWDQLSASDLENFQNQFPKHKGKLLIPRTTDTRWLNP